MIKRHRERNYAANADASKRRFQADDSAQRRRFTNRTRSIRTDRAIAKARRHRRRRTSGRSASDERRIPWITHFAVIADHRAAAIGKLMQVVLSKKHGPRIFQPPHHFGIFRRNPILEYRAGGGGAYPGGIDEIFQGERDAVQRPAPVSANNFILSAACLCKRQFCSHRDEGIQNRIQFLNLREALLRQFHGRQFPFAQQLAGFRNGLQPVLPSLIRSEYQLSSDVMRGLLRKAYNL